MSERTTENTFAGAQYCAKRPPLTAERCLRSVFISTMFAPQASSCFVMSSSSAAGMSGLSNSAEPPPESRKSTVSSAVRFSTSFIAASAEAKEFSSGTGWPALDDARVRKLALRVPVLRDYEPFVDFVAEYRAGGARHLPRRLAYGDHDEPAGAELASLERLCDRRVGQRRAQRFGYDFIRVFSDSAHLKKASPFIKSA